MEAEVAEARLPLGQMALEELQEVLEAQVSILILLEPLFKEQVAVADQEVPVLVLEVLEAAVLVLPRDQQLLELH